MNTIHDRIAASGAALSGASVGVSWLTTANEYVQLAAGIVAVLSGLATGIYFVLKIVHKRYMAETSNND